jgi:hypothetical protein
MRREKVGMYEGTMYTQAGTYVYSGRVGFDLCSSERKSGWVRTRKGDVD